MPATLDNPPEYWQPRPDPPPEGNPHSPYEAVPRDHPRECRRSFTYDGPGREGGHDTQWYPRYREGYHSHRIDDDDGWSLAPRNKAEDGEYRPSPPYREYAPSHRAHQTYYPRAPRGTYYRGAGRPWRGGPPSELSVSPRFPPEDLHRTHPDLNPAAQQFTPGRARGSWRGVRGDRGRGGRGGGRGSGRGRDTPRSASAHGGEVDINAYIQAGFEGPPSEPPAAVDAGARPVREGDARSSVLSPRTGETHGQWASHAQKEATETRANGDEERRPDITHPQLPNGKTPSTKASPSPHPAHGGADGAAVKVTPEDGPSISHHARTTGHVALEAEAPITSLSSNPATISKPRPEGGLEGCSRNAIGLRDLCPSVSASIPSPCGTGRRPSVSDATAIVPTGPIAPPPGLSLPPAAPATTPPSPTMIPLPPSADPSEAADTESGWSSGPRTPRLSPDRGSPHAERMRQGKLRRLEARVDLLSAQMEILQLELEGVREQVHAEVYGGDGGDL
ncbi:hypothetical protein BD413DRAFT_610910 [Trametes elegans]|nr:hypothetical protein BD413DRAFT_610910 [Trametes elegans]